MEDKSFSDKMRMFHSYFIQRKHAPPRQENTSYFIDPLRLAKELQSVQDRFAVTPLTSVMYQKTEFPMWDITQKETTLLGKKFLICSGIHGDETASIQAIPHVLKENILNPFTNSTIRIISPINPVGTAYGYHYNADGIDINKDLDACMTQEAQAVAGVIDHWQPDFILNMHEGPQTGAFIICNAKTPMDKAYEIAQELAHNGVPLAEKSFLMTKLSPPGVMPYNSLIKLGRKFLKLHSVGYYADKHNIPAISFESPIHSKLDERIAYQAEFLRSSLAVLSSE